MLDYIHLFFCIPCYIIGFICGYIMRPFMMAYYWGFYYLEVRENRKMVNELHRRFGHLIPKESNEEENESRNSLEQ